MKLRPIQWLCVLVLLAVCGTFEFGAASGKGPQTSTSYRVPITAVNSNLAQGTIAAGSTAFVQLMSDQNVVSVHVDGTYSASLAVYETVDGVRRYPLNTSLVTKQSDGTTGISSGAVGDWIAVVPPGSTVYVTCTSYTSGTAFVTVVGGASSGGGSSSSGGWSGPTTNPTILQTNFSVSSSGDNTVVAAVSAKKIYVVGYMFNVAGAVNCKFLDDTAGTQLSMLFQPSAAGAGYKEPTVHLVQGGFLQVLPTQTAVNKPLVLNLSSGVNVTGTIFYYTQ